MEMNRRKFLEQLGGLVGIVVGAPFISSCGDNLISPSGIRDGIIDEILESGQPIIYRATVLTVIPEKITDELKSAFITGTITMDLEAAFVDCEYNYTMKILQGTHPFYRYGTFKYEGNIRTSVPLNKIKFLDENTIRYTHYRFSDDILDVRASRIYD